MENYDPAVDYKRLHLEWINANKSFRPRGGVMSNYNSYYEEMTAMYGPHGFKRNESAYLCLRDDYNWHKHNKTVNDEVATIFGDKPVNNNPSFFVTFNWSDKNFKLDKILPGIEKLFKKSWIDNARGVFEYHGLEDNHPHFMCIIQVNKHKTWGRFKDKILQSALSQTLDKNFIDIKVHRSYHDDYLDLDKKQSKILCLERDVEWRKSLFLKEEYIK